MVDGKCFASTTLEEQHHCPILPCWRYCTKQLSSRSPSAGAQFAASALVAPPCRPNRLYIQNHALAVQVVEFAAVLDTGDNMSEVPGPLSLSAFGSPTTISRHQLQIRGFSTMQSSSAISPSLASIRGYSLS